VITILDLTITDVDLTHLLGEHWIVSGNGQFIAVQSVTAGTETTRLHELQTGKCLFSHVHMPGMLLPKFSIDSKYFSWFDGPITLRTMHVLSQLHTHIFIDGRNLVAFDFSPFKSLAVCTSEASDNPSYYIAIHHESGNRSDVIRSTDILWSESIQISFSVAGELVLVAGISVRNYCSVHTYGTVPLQLVRVWEDSGIPTVIRAPPLLYLGQDMACCVFSDAQHIKVNLISHEGSTTANSSSLIPHQQAEYIKAFVSGDRLFLLAQRGMKTRILGLDKEAMVFRAYGALPALSRKSYIRACGLTGKELEEFWWYDEGKVFKTRITLASEADNIELS